MNKIKNSWVLKGLSLCLLIAGLSGCKKYLDQVPENALTRDEFFKTEADANAAINGVYDALQACHDEFLRWGEFRADLIQSNNALDPVYLQSFDNTNAISSWIDPYKLIARANIVIEKVPQIPAFDSRFTDDESKEIVAEALFLRALTYFYLVRTFKEVPLILEAPSSDAVDFLKPKVNEDSLFNQIERDLVTAEKSLPADRGKAIETRGRATKGAANAMLTDAYLWRKQWVLAAAASKKVLDNTSLYSLVDPGNWFKIFSEKNATESIFEIQYDSQLGENNTLRSLSNSQVVNTSLFTLFQQENDLVRGLNRTYRQSGARQFWKYTGLTVDNVDRASDDPNFIVYRLPDVMLMRAEALIHVGDPQKVEAGDLINVIRKRAGLDSLENLNENTPVEVFNFIILKERALELAMEGKRWFDLVRIASNEEDPDILLSRVVTSRAVADRAQVRSRLVDKDAWYLPIHRDELFRNPNLVQNPYYK
jgi:starch-binding outer membrane protein, SusD/RagB family